MFRKLNFIFSNYIQEYIGTEELVINVGDIFRNASMQATVTVAIDQIRNDTERTLPKKLVLTSLFVLS